MKLADKLPLTRQPRANSLRGTPVLSEVLPKRPPRLDNLTPPSLPDVLGRQSYAPEAKSFWKRALFFSSSTFSLAYEHHSGLHDSLNRRLRGGSFVPQPAEIGRSSSIVVAPADGRDR